MDFPTLLNPTPVTLGRRYREALQPRRSANLLAQSSLGEPGPVQPPFKTPEPPPPAAAPWAPGAPQADDLLTFDPLRPQVSVRVEHALDAAFRRDPSPVQSLSVVRRPGGGQGLYARSPEPRGLSPDQRRRLRYGGWSCEHLETLAQLGHKPRGARAVQWVFAKHAMLREAGFSPLEVMALGQATPTARDQITGGLKTLTRWFRPQELVRLAQLRGATLVIPTLGQFMPMVLARGYRPADVLRLLGDGHGLRKLSTFARGPWPYPAYLCREQLLQILDQFILTEDWRNRA
jgi:hypothetical protein